VDTEEDSDPTEEARVWQ